MQSQPIQDVMNPDTLSRHPKRKRGRCCLSLVGIGIFFVGVLTLLIILGAELDRERITRLDGMMEALSQGKADQAYSFFAEQHRDKFTPEDLTSFVEENNLSGHTACQWELGAHDEHGNRIYNGTVTLRDGSVLNLFAPVVEEDDQWNVVALLTEEPELPKADESGDGGFEWGFSFTTATLKNIRITTEESSDAADQSEFAEDVEKIFCLAALAWAPSGTKIESKWYYLGPQGTDAEKELVSKTLEATQSSMDLSFHLFRKSDYFPVGRYRVKLLIDDKQQSVKEFLVRQLTIEEMAERGQSGNALALFRLGAAYMSGDGVTSDTEKGIQLIRQAAENGLPMAQYYYGIELRDGKFLPKDVPEAAKWMRRAAEQGNADAQYDLAVLYREGTGVPQNLTEAVVWTRKAAEQGDSMAQYNLGIHYKMGVGVTQDTTEAAKWLKLAVAQDNVQAMFSLAELHETGDGVTKDLDEAIRLYQNAADQGEAASKAALRRLGK